MLFWDIGADYRVFPKIHLYPYEGLSITWLDSLPALCVLDSSLRLALPYQNPSNGSSFPNEISPKTQSLFISPLADRAL